MEQSTPRNNDSNEIIENAVTPHTQSPLPHMQFFRSAAEASLRKKVAELMNINEAIRNKFAKIGITLDVVDYMNIESLKEKIILLQTENILSKEVRALLNNSLKQLQLEMEQLVEKHEHTQSKLDDRNEDVNNCIDEIMTLTNSILESKDKVLKLEEKLAKSNEEVSKLKELLAAKDMELKDSQTSLNDALMVDDNTAQGNGNTTNNNNNTVATGDGNTTAGSTASTFFTSPRNEIIRKQFEDDNVQPQTVELGSGGDLLYIPTKVAAKLKELNVRNMIRRSNGSAVMCYSSEDKTVHCSEADELVLLALMDLTLRYLTMVSTATDRSLRHYLAMEREYFYCLKTLVKEQSDLKQYFEVLAEMCNVPIASLACRAAPDGRWIGRMVIRRNGQFFNAADENIVANQPMGFDPPTDIILFHLEGLENREGIALISDAKVGILCEDWGVYNALLFDQFYNRVPSIIVLSRGHGSFDTVAWVNVLSKYLKIPFISVGDLNSGNIRVFNAYDESTRRTNHCKHLGELSTKVQWWGVRVSQLMEGRFKCRRFPNGIQGTDWDGTLKPGLDHIEHDCTENNMGVLESYLNDDDFLNSGCNPEGRVHELSLQKAYGKKVESEVISVESLLDVLEEDLIIFLYDEEKNKKEKRII